MKLIVHDEARFDVIDLAYYIAEDNIDASNRFIDALSASYIRLMDMPNLGVSRDFHNPLLKGIRMWPIPGFSKYLIFYRLITDELHIYRILHGSRDIDAVFGDV